MLANKRVFIVGWAGFIKPNIAIDWPNTTMNCFVECRFIDENRKMKVDVGLDKAISLTYALANAYPLAYSAHFHQHCLQQNV
jgi:hypothetical protein